jgi:hypothetical protein
MGFSNYQNVERSRSRIIDSFGSDLSDPGQMLLNCDLGDVSLGSPACAIEALHSLCWLLSPNNFHADRIMTTYGEHACEPLSDLTRSHGEKIHFSAP